MTDRLQKKTRLIYILGCSRSGSTIVDILLNTHPQICGIGEVDNCIRGTFAQNLYCACGKKGPECPFWKEVMAEWQRISGGFQIDEFLGYQKEFESQFGALKLRIAEKMRPRDFFRYLSLLGGLYQAVSRVSGKDIIVDSSKQIHRAYALSRVAGIDLTLIHLIRDGRGYVLSMKKTFVKDDRKGVQKDLPSQTVFDSTLKWVIQNFKCEVAKRLTPAHARLTSRYEDLLTQPDIELSRIGKAVGFDPEELIKIVLIRGEVVPGHQIAGNRVRMGGIIKVGLNSEWGNKLSLKEKSTFWSLAGWFSKKYGYEK